MRMVASQAVASEFAVTGCFLAISAACHFMNENGFVAYFQLVPLQTGVSAECDSPCVCDGDGTVGGAYSGFEGGCALRAVLPRGWLGVDSTALAQPLCLVPSACEDNVGNSTTFEAIFFRKKL